MNLTGLGYIAGGAETGLNDNARRVLEQLQAQAMKDSTAAQGAFGRGLTQAYAPGSMPQQGAVPGASPIASLLSKFGGAPAQSPPQPAPGPPGAPAAPAPAATPQGPPAGGAPQGGLPPQAAQQVKQLDFPSLVKAIVQANPGIKPEVLGQAMEKLTPFMNAQALQQYRQTMTQLAPERMRMQEQDLQSKIQDRGVRQDQGQERIDVSKERETRLSGQFKDNLDVAKAKLAEATRSTDVRSRQSAISDAEREVNRAQSLVQNEMLYGGSDPNKDARMKEFQTQLDAAKAQVDAAKAAPVPPANYEGKDQGRVPPETVPGKRLQTSQVPAAAAKPQRPQPGQPIPFPDGSKRSWNGKEPYDDPANWTTAGGGVSDAPRAQ